VILTHGRDATVESFLRAAAKKRPFEVGARSGE
jgi:translation initiation factor 2B subunit (eIF-2B alpha/beta/delta family)